MHVAQYLSEMQLITSNVMLQNHLQTVQYLFKVNIVITTFSHFVIISPALGVHSDSLSSPFVFPHILMWVSYIIKKNVIIITYSKNLNIDSVDFFF